MVSCCCRLRSRWRPLVALVRFRKTMLGDPQAHCREVKGLPARRPRSNVLECELTLANPVLFLQLFDDLVHTQTALKRLAQVPWLSATRLAFELSQCRTLGLLAIAVIAWRAGRVPTGLTLAIAQLGVLALQQFSNLSGLGEHWFSQAFTSDGIFALMGSN